MILFSSSDLVIYPDTQVEDRRPTVCSGGHSFPKGFTANHPRTTWPKATEIEPWLHPECSHLETPRVPKHICNTFPHRQPHPQGKDTVNLSSLASLLWPSYETVPQAATELPGPASNPAGQGQNEDSDMVLLCVRQCDRQHLIVPCPATSSVTPTNCELARLPVSPGPAVTC